ncbi:hypothetical protein [Bacillus sp. OK048]|uniref:hypothetical protein n=1 Tax=Bacillus sp. OK048 TaxID=1882761 RepID=UPI00088D20E8|nr:hypothetical protein [Bacillus sp. OK048]SDN39129.1 hypothetical protein SAMN05443253_11171 [Bacillus sp. OK048]
MKRIIKMVIIPMMTKIHEKIIEMVIIIPMMTKIHEKIIEMVIIINSFTLKNLPDLVNGEGLLRETLVV